ncbi:MAG: hypothetical protein EAZ16_09685 [Sphingobacteriales bacterium]|nr:MAG: hypothetical protein EAZ16_09685 [Sphingobacteriales bacterium]
MKRLFYSILLLVFFYNSFGQVPALINYQGAARDKNGQVLANKKMMIRISILNGPDGAAEYTETRQVQTNMMGLFNIAIGAPGMFSSMGSVKEVKWEQGNRFIQLEIAPDKEDDFIKLGQSQLLSVPYAFVAGTSLDAKTGNAGGEGNEKYFAKWGQKNKLSHSPLFQEHAGQLLYDFSDTTKNYGTVVLGEESNNTVQDTLPFLFFRMKFKGDLNNQPRKPVYLVDIAPMGDQHTSTHGYYGKTIGYSPNINVPASDTGDIVIWEGYNSEEFPGYKPNDFSYGTQHELRYNQGAVGVELTEYFRTLTTAGRFGAKRGFRPYNEYMAHDGSIQNIGVNVTRFYVADTSSTPVLDVLVSKGKAKMQVNGGTEFQFMKNNVPIIYQATASGTSAINLLYVDSTDHIVINPSGNGTEISNQGTFTKVGNGLHTDGLLKSNYAGIGGLLIGAPVTNTGIQNSVLMGNAKWLAGGEGNFISNYSTASELSNGNLGFINASYINGHAVSVAGAHTAIIAANNSTLSNVEHSLVVGQLNYTPGIRFSTLLGQSLNVGAHYSFTAGEGLINYANNATVLGSFNAGVSGTTDAYQPNEWLLQLANGTAANKSNALTITKRGWMQLRTYEGNNPAALAENDITPKAALEIVSTNSGFLAPRLTIVQRNAMANLQDGLMIYCTDEVDNNGNAGVMQVYQASTATWKKLF